MAKQLKKEALQGTNIVHWSCEGWLVGYDGAAGFVYRCARGLSKTRLRKQ